ncbi:MAG TPA: hypothetical protein VHB79_29080 [Polyangiaceae bacterium]|nr:hypothetical protein [Polyangiaceae bacterium]
MSNAGSPAAGGSSGSASTASGGFTSLSGSANGGTDTAGAAQAGGSTVGNAGGGMGGASAGSGNVAGTGVVFGGDEGKFPTLDLPLALPEPTAAAPCPTGSIISKSDSPSLYSWPGTVFGDVPPSGQGENHSPAKLQVTVTNGGQPVSGCEVRFRAPAGNGWGFAASKTTDAQGKLYGYWTAGNPGNASISAVIALPGGSESKVDFSGVVAEHESRTDSVHLYYDADGSYTEFKVRITPLSTPPATYYSALNWQDSYAGIQFDGDTTTVIFSVWDAGGEKAQISDQGACNELVGFGGEGTGTSCRLRFPPSQHGKVAGLPDDYRLEAGNTYELHLSMKASPSGGTAHSITFSDLTRQLGPISVGTQTTGTAFAGGGHASGFVEEWTPHGSCMSHSRAVLYHGLRALVAGSWVDVKGASFQPNYVNTNNEVCGNYLATGLSVGSQHALLMSSGGDAYVGRPYVPADAAFKKPVTTITLP